MPETKTRRASEADVDAQVLGSGNPETQEETRAGIHESVGEEAYLADPERFWTAQHGPMPDTGTAAALGPQKYLPQQLPDPDIARAAGITPQTIPSSIVIDTEAGAEGTYDPKGPEPGEIVRLVVNDATNKHMLDEAERNPESRRFLTLTGDGVRGIKAAQEAGAEPQEGADGAEGDDDDTEPENGPQGAPDGSEGSGSGQQEPPAPDKDAKAKAE